VLHGYDARRSSFVFRTLMVLNILLLLHALLRVYTFLSLPVPTGQFALQFVASPFQLLANLAVWLEFDLFGRAVRAALVSFKVVALLALYRPRSFSIGAFGFHCQTMVYGVGLQLSGIERRDDCLFRCAALMACGPTVRLHTE
jgi:hypothetical protein